MIEPIQDRGQQLPVPEGKVIGIVNSRNDFDTVTRALNRAGYPNDSMNALFGADGIEMLQRLRETAFFGDWERAVVDEGIGELEKGHYVLCVRVEDADEAARIAHIATPLGAHTFNYFGMWINEQLTK